MFAVGTNYASEVVEILRRLGQPIHGLVANIADAPVPQGVGPIAEAGAIPTSWRRRPVVVPLTTPGHRKFAVDHARALGFRRFPAVVDPTAIVASTATLGEGAVVNAGAIIGAHARLGAFSSLNRGSSVGHHVTLGDYVSLGPGCVLCGHVSIGPGGYIGAGAVLLPEVTVGGNAVVAAGAVVMADVPERSVVMGNPARIVQEGIAGYNGASV
jgi:sugar O-acyltransferase (sialic acid O-acetyltransferase NeuD family)